ncbi:MAG: PD-(D/E)XK nuclease family protein [Thermodesulfovibrionales bacterium]|nr:PD-(D/E)XK nuclease family protein [Thermodesulfovibrionales bacterium]
MKVDVFYVPSGFGNTAETLLREALSSISGPDYSGMLYIAPTRQMADERMKVFHELATKEGASCYIPPEMTTIKQLSKRLNSSFGDKITLPSSLMPVILSGISGKGIGLSAIIAGFISELKGVTTPGERGTNPFIKELEARFAKIFEELSVPHAVSQRVMDSLGVFSGHQGLMDDYGAQDEDDAIVSALAIIKERLSPDVLVLDGFYDITGAEKAVIQALTGKAGRVIAAVPHDAGESAVPEEYINFMKNNFDVREIFLTCRGVRNPCRKVFPEAQYHPFPSVEEEVEGIARHIKSSFISGRLRRLDRVIAAFPSIGQYRDTVLRVFARYGIPAAASPKSLSETRPFLEALSLLESVTEDYPRLAFSNFLLSPHFTNIPEALKKAVPRLCSGSGIIKGRQQWLSAFKAEGQEVHAAGKRIFRRLEPLESIKGRGSYTDYLNALYEALKGLGFTAALSEEQPGLSESGDFKDIFRGVGAVDAIAKTRTDIRGFSEAVRYILDRTFGEAEGEGVRVMGMSDAMGLEPDFLYLGGLKDGDMPSMPKMDHLLPDNVRTRLGLRNLKRHLLTEEFVFSRLRASGGGVYLTYPTMDGEKFFLPSLFLSGAEEKKERVSGVLSPEEELQAAGTKKGVPLSVHIKEIKGLMAAGRRYSENSPIYVTDIDGYRRCPRRFFIEKLLRLEPPEVKEYELEALTIGTIIHEVMEKLIPASDAGFDSFRQAASRVLDETLKEEEIEDYWKSLIKESFLESLPEIHSMEESMRDEGFSFKSAEAAVEGEPIKGIRLRGKIDRIDERGATPAEGLQTLALIDYKTGGAGFSGSRILGKGESLQLFLYAALLRTMNLKAERVGIYSLKDVSLKWIPSRNDRKHGRTLDDYITAALGFLEETVGKMRQGDFEALPIDGGVICRQCHERPYCPYIQGGG